MPLNPNEVMIARKALRDNGFHHDAPDEGEWITHTSYTTKGKCAVSKSGESFYVATSLAHVATALREEFVPEAPIGAPIGGQAFIAADSVALNRLIRRIFDLTRALPNEPWDVFVQQTQHLPSVTEAERLVIQRIGQAMFRDALMAYWGGACAVTGLDQPELLRASHIKPWAKCANQPMERLDVHNGLLLRADFDAAFDVGLITFDQNGIALMSPRLSPAANEHFSSAKILNRTLLSLAHRQFLQWHHAHVFLGG